MRLAGCDAGPGTETPPPLLPWGWPTRLDDSFLRTARKRLAGLRPQPRPAPPQQSTTSGCAIAMATECAPIELLPKSGSEGRLLVDIRKPISLCGYSHRGDSSHHRWTGMSGGRRRLLKCVA